MKKFYTALLVLVFCFSALFSSTVYGTEATDSLHPEIIPPAKPPEYVGTTPFFGTIRLLGEIPEESTDISNQIYQNILKQNPELFIYSDYGIQTLNGWDDMNEEELEYVRVFSEDLLEDCTTADEKISAVACYVAKNVGYDLDYYYDAEKDYAEINHSAYDVLVNGSAVCYGYSTATSALLQLSGVPCIIIISPEHAWNMAYNGERWILFDTTWMSKSTYKDNALTKIDEVREEWFDFSIEDANSDSNHIIEDADYCEYDNAIYTFPVYTSQRRFTIPQYITRIGEYAFCNCLLDSVTFNGTLSEVERYAFANCRNLLGEINIENVVNVGEFAFYECEDAGLILGNKLETADTCAFYDCTGITGDVHLENLTIAGDYAFYECAEADIYFGNKLTYIGNAAFYECESAKGTVNLRNAEFIGEFAFHDCLSITGVILSEKISSVSKAAFQLCTSLNKIVIPKNITTIEDYAFSLFNNRWDISVYYNGTKEEWDNISVDPQYNAWLFNSANIEYNYRPHMDAPELSSDKKSVTVNYAGIPLGETVYFAEYENGKFLGIKSKVLTDSVSFNLSNETSDKAVFFIMKDSSLSPLTPSASINLK